MTRQNFLQQIEKDVERIKKELRKRPHVSITNPIETTVGLPNILAFAQKLPKPTKMDLTTQDSVLKLANKVR